MCFIPYYSCSYPPFLTPSNSNQEMVEVWNQESAPIYIIRNKAEGPATDKRNTKMLAKTYPDLADLVNASTENDASLGPAIKEHPRKKRKF